MANIPTNILNYAIPPNAEYASFICLNCGMRGISIADKECPSCSTNGFVRDSRKLALNRDISINIGLLIMSVISKQSGDKSDLPVQSIQGVVEEALTEWENKEKNNRRLLGKWFTLYTQKLTHEGISLVEHYKGELQFLNRPRLGFIRKISVKGLFGLYDYTISLPEDISVIVGPNAIGKTTVFSLLESLLTYPDDEINAQYLLETVYQEFSISFEGGSSISLKKTKDGVVISYENMANMRGFTNRNAELEDNILLLFNDTSVQLARKMEQHFKRVNEVMHIEKNQFYFSKIKRSLDVNSIRNSIVASLNNSFDMKQVFIESMKTYRSTGNPFRFLESIWNASIQLNEDNAMTQIIGLHDSWQLFNSFSDKLEHIIKEKIFESVNSNSERIIPFFVLDFKQSMLDNWNYIIKAIEENGVGQDPQEVLLTENAIVALNRIIDRKLYDKSLPDIEKVLSLLKQLKPVDITKKRNSISNDICVRIDSLDDMVKKFDYFSEVISDFYYDDDKSKKYPIIKENLEIGFCLAENDVVLSAYELSSGELNIASVIYDTIFKLKNGAVLLVDEPEVSLHLVWQHHYIEAILGILKHFNLNSQVIIASHSPFIASGHSEFLTGADYESATI